MNRARFAATATILIVALAVTVACSSSKLASTGPEVTPRETDDASPGATGTDATAPPSDASTEAAAACAVVPVTVCPDAGVPTYTDVAPIFQARCASCHKGDDGGPWPLDTYDPIADWQGEVRGTLLNCSMPPADSGVSVPDDEMAKLLTWIKCGLPK